MRKYLVKGYMIVHGQKIKVMQDVLHRDRPEYAVIFFRNRLKKAFEKQSNIVEFDNCVFEKDACSGVFVEIDDIGPQYKIFQKIWIFIKRKWPIEFKKWKQEYGN